MSLYSFSETVYFIFEICYHYSLSFNHCISLWYSYLMITVSFSWVAAVASVAVEFVLLLLSFVC